MKLFVQPPDLVPFSSKDRDLENRVEYLELLDLLPRQVEGEVHVTRVTIVTEQLPEHSHKSAAQGGYFPWADITGFSTSPAITLGASPSQGTSTTVLRSNATIRAFDTSPPSTLTVGAAPSTGSVAYAARRDHVHGMPGFGDISNVTLTKNLGTSSLLARADHVHALSQSITPTWTGAHTWMVDSSGAISIGGSTGGPFFRVDTVSQCVGVGTGLTPTHPLHVKYPSTQLKLEYDSLNYTTIGTTGGGILELAPSGGVVRLHFQKGSLEPLVSHSVDLGSLTQKFRAVHAAELWVETLVAQDTLATIGGRILVGPTTVLEQEVESTDTTIVVRHNNLSVGDIIYLEAGGRMEFMRVTDGPTLLSTLDFRHTSNTPYLGLL